MGRTKILSSIIILSLLICSAAGSGAGSSRKRARRTRKLTSMVVYWQDAVSGAKPTSVMLIRPPAMNSSTGFGMTRVIDNALTVGRGNESKVVGRAQGLYASTSQTLPPCLLMAMNFVFTDGDFRGSSITLLGQNHVLSTLREMPVVGGTGKFRFAQGYALLTTERFDLKTGDATVKYRLFVYHY